jgi:hypothetical protein
MVIVLAETIQKSPHPNIYFDETQLRLDINLSVRLGITAKQAKRKLTRFFMDEVSLLIGPEAPSLVFTNENDICWRFPVTLSMGQQGVVGQVGQVDVNAKTGELLLNDTLIEEIKINAKQLAQPTAYPTKQ